MQRFVLLTLIVGLFVGTPLGTAQGAPIAEVTVSDTDADGIEDAVDACPNDVGLADSDPKKNGCTARALARIWAFNFLVKYASPGHKTYYKEAEETKEEALARYHSIASDLVSVVFDPDIQPVFAGPHGRSQTVSILLGVMFWETALRKDVDYGLGSYSRGDNGRSWCLMQINIGDGRTPGGFSGEDLVKDRKACFMEGMRIVRGSFSVCRSMPFDQRLSAYASGSCDKGREKSKQRVRTGMRWFSQSPRLFTDEAAVAEGVVKGISGLVQSEPFISPPKGKDS